jgi:hypothetical protein
VSFIGTISAGLAALHLAQVDGAGREGDPVPGEPEHGRWPAGRVEHDRDGEPDLGLDRRGLQALRLVLGQPALPRLAADWDLELEQRAEAPGPASARRAAA